MFQESKIKAAFALVAAGLALAAGGVPTHWADRGDPGATPVAPAVLTFHPSAPPAAPGEGETLLAVPDCEATHNVGPCVTWAGESGGWPWWLGVPLHGDPILMPECRTEDGGTACVWPQPQVDTGFIPTFGGLL